MNQQQSLLCFQQTMAIRFGRWRASDELNAAGAPCSIIINIWNLNSERQSQFTNFVVQRQWSKLSISILITFTGAFIVFCRLLAIRDWIFIDIFQPISWFIWHSCKCRTYGYELLSFRLQFPLFTINQHYRSPFYVAPYVWAKDIIWISIFLSSTRASCPQMNPLLRANVRINSTSVGVWVCVRSCVVGRSRKICDNN